MIHIGDKEEHSGMRNDWQYRQVGPQHFFWFPAVLKGAEAEARWFTPQFWQQFGEVRAHGGGRNPVYMVTDGQARLVLRHYYRGGLPGKLIKRRFQWQGLGEARSVAEFKLLSWLREQQLPVPKPVAAMVERTWGWGYRASILLQRIPASRNLHERLQQGALEEDGWYAIGATIGRFHQQGVFHSDLNCRNILLQGDTQIWLIDFDKCERRPAAADWQQQNLQRLLRSCHKEQSRTKNFAFTDEGWQALLAGYQTVNPIPVG